MDASAGLDIARVRRAFDRAAPTYSQVAHVSREVERRMAEKLDYVKVRPGRILDAGAGTGFGVALLRKRFPAAELIGLDIAPAMLREARAGRSLLDRVKSVAARRPVRWIGADFSRLPLRSATVDMVWSNLALAWANDPLQVLRESHRVLTDSGLLMFSTYGPDTLKELKSAFAAVDRDAHVHGFTDMHDLGDMMVAAGFDAPVMEMESIVVTYPDVAALARDLKRSGQTCALHERRRGLVTPRAWSRLLAAYEKSRRAGVLPATMEIVYGHAWKGAPGTTANGGKIVRFARGQDFSA